MYGMTPMGVFFTAIFPLEINEQALCQQPQLVVNPGMTGFCLTVIAAIWLSMYR